MKPEIWMYLAVMAGVTYAVRVLPLTLIRGQIENRFLRSFLYYVPYVTLAVMTFPAIADRGRARACRGHRPRVARGKPFQGILRLLLRCAGGRTLFVQIKTCRIRSERPGTACSQCPQWTRSWAAKTASTPSVTLSRT